MKRCAAPGRAAGGAAPRILIVFFVLLAGGCAGDGFRIEGEELLQSYRARPDHRPLVVVDMDDTLVPAGTWNFLRLALHLAYPGVEPLEEAPAILSEIAGRSSLVIVTARDEWFRGETLAWLEAHHFPRAPVVFSRHFLCTDRSREEWKSRAIRSLLERGFKPGWGVGDKPSDMLAYRANGLRTVLILEGPRDPDLGRTLEALGVTGLGAAFLGRSGGAPDLIAIGKRTAWAEIRRSVETYLDAPAPRAAGGVQAPAGTCASLEAASPRGSLMSPTTNQ
jgi:hypothetical protein